jgi:hypothetical protein
MTQNNLGKALEALGERESGTGRLEEARGAIGSAWSVYRGAGVALIPFMPTWNQYLTDSKAPNAVQFPPGARKFALIQQNPCEHIVIHVAAGSHQAHTFPA